MRCFVHQKGSHFFYTDYKIKNQIRFFIENKQYNVLKLVKTGKFFQCFFFVYRLFRFKGSKVQRFKGTEVQRYKGAEVQRCRGAEAER
ncbi:hypothetical protein C4F50_18755 [Flavobacterium sp. KB82]|uniref:Uncharacterized protein n=1 Tax=Flavobacterium hungaricum TaxID=2082725 RepID=A0ABR9TPL3_9FLAO|nr:hypothetical protein [Flavobacterium hungaricum]